MIRPRQALLAFVTAAMATAPLLFAASTVAAAASLPFSDRNATASLGFCDMTGHEVKSGSIAAAPFAWYAMSTAAVPAGYDKGKATLYAFQPIKNVDPGNWSGQQLTASSTFTNPNHPVAAGTVIDTALQDFDSAFPSKIDNLVQLRMYFNSPIKGQYRDTYPAAVVRVSGPTWTLVQGGGVPCTAGKGTSSETDALPRSAFSSVSRPTPPTDAPKATRNTSSSVPTDHGTSNGPPSTPESTDATSGVAARSSSSSGHGSAGVVAVIAAAVVIVVGGLGIYWYLRRRPDAA